MSVKSVLVCVSFVNLTREDFERLTEKRVLSLEISRGQVDSRKKSVLWR